MESTKAVMRILKRGSPKPPKNPTISINRVAIVTIPGITQIIAPMLPARIAANITVPTIKHAIVMAIGCLHTSSI